MVNPKGLPLGLAADQNGRAEAKLINQLLKLYTRRGKMSMPIFKGINNNKSSIHEVDYLG